MYKKMLGEKTVVIEQQDKEIDELRRRIYLLEKELRETRALLAKIQEQKGNGS